MQGQYKTGLPGAATIPEKGKKWPTEYLSPLTVSYWIITFLLPVSIGTWIQGGFDFEAVDSIWIWTGLRFLFLVVISSAPLCLKHWTGSVIIIFVLITSALTPAAVGYFTRNKGVERRRRYSLVVGIAFTCFMIGAMLLSANNQAAEPPLLVTIKIFALISHGAFLGLSCYLSSEIFKK